MSSKVVPIAPDDAPVPGPGDAPEATPAPSAYLCICTGDQAGLQFPLEEDEVLIGRGPDCGLVLDDERVSAEHARLFVAAATHRVVDLDSSNGVYVNNEKIMNSSLRDGDLIDLGGVILQYVHRSSAAKPVADTIIRDGAVPGDLAVGARNALDAARTIPDVLPSAPTSALVPTGHLNRHPAEPLPNRGWVIDDRTADDEFDLGDFVHRIRRIVDFFWPHRRLIFAAFLLGALGGVASYFLSPPPARASFEISLRGGVTENPIQQFERKNIEFFGSAETNFRSQALIESTLARMGESERSAARLTAVQKSLSLSPIGFENTYKGSFEHEDSGWALSFLENHVQTYLDTEIEKTIKVIRVEADFLARQLAQTEQELRRTETELLAFKSNNIDGLPDQARQYYELLFSLEQQRSQNQSQIARLRAQANLDRQRLAQTPALVESRVLTTRPYQQALVDAQRELAAARASGKGDSHPDVIRLRKSVERYRSLAAQSKSDGTETEQRRNPVHDAVQASVHNLDVAQNVARKEAGRIEAELAKIRGIVKKLPELEASYKELTRSYDATQAHHTKIFEQLKTTELQLELEKASASARYDIITPPTLEFISAQSVIAKRAFLFSFAGLLLALAVATGIEVQRRYL